MIHVLLGPLCLSSGGEKNVSFRDCIVIWFRVEKNYFRLHGGGATSVYKGPTNKYAPGNSL